jgi:hypothetical protein
LKLFLKLFFLINIFTFCSSGDSDGGDGSGPVDPPTEIKPLNLQLTAIIVGSDSNNPNGDGSGTVKFTATATNAVSYSFRFGTGDSKTSTGSSDYTYKEVGTKTYNIKVIAYSSTSHYVSVDKTITVYVKPESEQTLLVVHLKPGELTLLKMLIFLMVFKISDIQLIGKLMLFLNQILGFTMMNILLILMELILTKQTKLYLERATI